MKNLKEVLVKGSICNIAYLNKNSQTNTAVFLNMSLTSKHKKMA